MTALKEHETHLDIFTNDKKVIKKLDEVLKAKRPGADHEPKVQMGQDDGYTRFYKATNYKDGKYFRVNRGFLSTISNAIIFNQADYLPKIQVGDRLEFLKRIIPTLPFKPRKYQLQAFMKFTENRMYFASMCTSSGKSLVAYLTLLYFWENNFKSILLVPTISLTLQMQNDFSEYLAPQKFLDDIKLIGGEFTDKKLDKSIVIGTYQSLIKVTEFMSNYDVILTDESHLSSAETMQTILKQPFKIKLGMTGSVPIITVDKMAIVGVFGEPDYIIKARDLMDQGLLTDSTITPLFVNYKRLQDGLRSGLKYQEEVKFIKESPSRRRFVKKFISSLPGLSVGLYAHTEHGEETYKSLTGEYPRANDMDRMKELGVYFVSGKTKGSIREKIRIHTNTIDKGIIIANYKVFSTGINLPNLSNIILLSSTKSYVTILQSLGRVFRLREGKKHARIFDLVDCFPYARESYALTHFWDRLAAYNQENHRIIEREIDLSKYVEQ